MKLYSKDIPVQQHASYAVLVFMTNSITHSHTSTLTHSFIHHSLIHSLAQPLSHQMRAYKNLRFGRRSTTSCLCGRGSLSASSCAGGRHSVGCGASETTSTATRKRRGEWTGGKRLGLLMSKMLLMFGQEKSYL